MSDGTTVTWRNTHRRWKRAVEEAISPVFYSCERDLLGAEIAKRIWMAYGGQQSTDARSEASLLMLEAMVDRHLKESVLRASLALRYLETLAEHVRRADYEDAKQLVKEAQWSEAYVRKEVPCTLLNDTYDDMATEPLARARWRRECLCEALVKLASDELRNAGVAA